MKLRGARVSQGIFVDDWLRHVIGVDREYRQSLIAGCQIVVEMASSRVVEQVRPRSGVANTLPGMLSDAPKKGLMISYIVYSRYMDSARSSDSCSCKFR